MERNGSQWKQFLESPNPEEHIPTIGVKASQTERALINCIIMKIFRPDKFNIVSNNLLRIVLGDKCIDDQTLDLKKVITSCKAK
jgi:dynein heavy chain 1